MTNEKKKRAVFASTVSSVSLQTTTTSSGLAPGGIGGDGRDVLDASDLHSVSCQGTEGGLGSGSGAAGLGSTGSPNLDVEGGEAELLALLRNVLGGKHGGVRRGFVTVGLDLHSPGDSDERFSARKIGDVNECIIEGSEQVGDTEDFFSVLDADTADFLGSFFTAVRCVDIDKKRGLQIDRSFSSVKSHGCCVLMCIIQIAETNCGSNKTNNNVDGSMDTVREHKR